MASEFTFLHSADLHLGRRFGTMPEDVRSRLTEARHQSLDRLGTAALAQGARDIFLAGDTFDTETPSDPVWRQALSAMARFDTLRWWVLPGNHDSLSSELLWPRLIGQAPANVTVITKAEPIALTPDVTLLPSPLPRRRPSHDLTAWMSDASTAPGTLRLGLAHGAVTDFSSEGNAVDGVIAPDRARLAGLDYLALGDWHGQKTLGDRTAYAGTPEYDSFRHTGRGACLAVTARAGAAPVITPVETGQFHWQQSDLSLISGMDPRPLMQAALPADAGTRRDQLLRITATGHLSLSEIQTINETLQQLAPEFAYFQCDLKGLHPEISTADLDMLDHGGALRVAAEQLVQDAQSDALSAPERQIAAAALSRLFGYLQDAP